MHNHLNLLRDCPKPTENQKEEDYLNCEGRINALEKLAKAKRLPKYINLESANLESANLESANLESAYLESAYLESAYLESAYLESAYLTDAENLTNEQIKSACYWEKAYFAKRWDEKQLKWVVNDVENQKRIAEIKADKSSDPETPVDCSWWE